MAGFASIFLLNVTPDFKYFAEQIKLLTLTLCSVWHTSWSVAPHFVKYKEVLNKFPEYLVALDTQIRQYPWVQSEASIGTKTKLLCERHFIN